MLPKYGALKPYNYSLKKALRCLKKHNYSYFFTLCPGFYISNLFNFSQSNDQEIISLYCFNLHFSSYQWSWAFFFFFWTFLWITGVYSFAHSSTGLSFLNKFLGVLWVFFHIFWLLFACYIFSIFSFIYGTFTIHYILIFMLSFVNIFYGFLKTSFMNFHNSKDIFSYNLLHYFYISCSFIFENNLSVKSPNIIFWKMGGNFLYKSFIFLHSSYFFRERANGGECKGRER